MARRGEGQADSAGAAPSRQGAGEASLDAGRADDASPMGAPPEGEVREGAVPEAVAGSAPAALSVEERLLVRLSAAVVAPGREALEAAVRAAAAGAGARAAEEVLLQSHLFAGYPAALVALEAWRRHAGPTNAEPEAPPAEGVRARGEAVCQVVYGGQYPRLRSNVAALHPELERWMLEDGYGRVLGRPGLSLALRELCIVALAAGLEAPRQLYSHLRGALNAGASVAAVGAALAEAAQVHPAERSAAAAGVWQEVRDRWREGQGTGPSMEGSG